jgi:hypothetical protein
MEPYHQLRFLSEECASIESALSDAGITLENLDGECWLQSPGFRNVRFVLGEQRTVFAVGADPSNARCILYVYPNVRSTHVNDRIRKIAENAGAEWGYFSS